MVRSFCNNSTFYKLKIANISVYRIGKHVKNNTYIERPTSNKMAVSMKEFVTFSFICSVMSSFLLHSDPLPTHTPAQKIIVSFFCCSELFEIMSLSGWHNFLKEDFFKELFKKQKKSNSYSQTSRGK